VEAAKRIAIVSAPSTLTLSGKLPATKHGSHGTIALTGVEPFQDARPPDAKALLARVIALEDSEDVQASLANRLTDLER